LSEEGKITNFEIRARTKTGRIIDTLVSLEKITIKGQEYSLSINIDITARKQAENEIIHLASYPDLNPILFLKSVRMAALGMRILLQK